MLLYKKISYQISKLTKNFRLLNVNFSSLIVSAFFIMVMVTLSVNIYNTFTNGIETIDKFRAEQEKLDELQRINAELKDQVEHYASLEYKKIYARDNLNLGEQNETLYYINRPDESLIIEELPEQEVEITFDDNISYWKKLILGL